MGGVRLDVRCSYIYAGVHCSGLGTLVARTTFGKQILFFVFCFQQEKQIQNAESRKFCQNQSSTNSPSQILDTEESRKLNM